MGFNMESLGNLGNLLGKQTGGDFKLDLNSIQQAVQSNPQMLQMLASAIGQAKTPDEQTVRTLKDAVTEVTEKAPAEKIDSALKALAGETAQDTGGFWNKLQPYLANAEHLGKLLPLFSQYAPKAMEALKTLESLKNLTGVLPFLK